MILPAPVICKFTTTIETKQINDSHAGIKYLEDLKHKYLNEKSKDKDPQIWINLASKKNGQPDKSLHTKNSNSKKNGQPDKSPQTKNSNSKKDGLQQKDNSNLTRVLLEDGQIKIEYYLLNEAMKQLTQKEQTSTDISSLTAIIIEPDRSKNSQCSFEKLLGDRK